MNIGSNTASLSCTLAWTSKLELIFCRSFYHNTDNETSPDLTDELLENLEDAIASVIGPDGMDARSNNMDTS
jgi:hypothetical protein